MLFQTTVSHFEEVLAESHEKTVLLDFYAPWCAPCRALAPVIDALSDRCEDVLSAYSVNVDTDGAIAERYDVTELPTVLILRNGEVTKRFAKEITEDMLEEAIRSAAQ